MWIITDQRLEKTRVHFAESEAKRDARRIYRRNADIEVDEDATQKKQNAEYAKGNQVNPFPFNTFWSGDDFDLPFDRQKWNDLFDDEDDLRNGPAMDEDEYLTGSEPADDKVGLAAFSDDEEVDDALASLSVDDDDDEALV